jgi:hypothetical protein
MSIEHAGPLAVPSAVPSSPVAPGPAVPTEGHEERPEAGSLGDLYLSDLDLERISAEAMWLANFDEYGLLCEFTRKRCVVQKLPSGRKCPCVTCRLAVAVGFMQSVAFLVAQARTLGAEVRRLHSLQAARRGADETRGDREVMS